MKSILLDEKLLGLVEMTSGLANASFSLPERQAVKIIFFAPCFLHPLKRLQSGLKQFLAICNSLQMLEYELQFVPDNN